MCLPSNKQSWRDVSSLGTRQNTTAEYHDYPVARLTEAPYETHVHLLPSHDLPAGVGEPAVPPTIPALCNALFAATGKRSRQLPIKHTKLT